MTRKSKRIDSGTSDRRGGGKWQEAVRVKKKKKNCGGEEKVEGNFGRRALNGKGRKIQETPGQGRSQRVYWGCGLGPHRKSLGVGGREQTLQREGGSSGLQERSVLLEGISVLRFEEGGGRVERHWSRQCGGRRTDWDGRW